MAAPRNGFGRGRKFMRLSGPEKAVFLKAAGLLPLVAVGLRLSGFASVQTKLAQLAGPSSRFGRPAELAVDVATVAALVELAARKGPVRVNCLERSLALWFLLQRRGVAADLRVGVRVASAAERATFHAWIEHQGQVINDTSDVGYRYQPFRMSLMPDGASFD